MCNCYAIRIYQAWIPVSLDCHETGENVFHFVRLEEKIGENFGNKIIEYVKYIIDKHTLFTSVQYSI